MQWRKLSRKMNWPVTGSPYAAVWSPPPLFTASLGAKRDAVTGFTADVVPPYMPYRANTNQVSAFGNPFAPETFEQRWYSTGCPVH